MILGAALGGTCVLGDARPRAGPACSALGGAQLAARWAAGVAFAPWDCLFPAAPGPTVRGEAAW